MEFEQEPEAPEVTLNAPIYNANHVRLGAFIGGPLIAGYFVAENYKVFGDYAKAKMAWLYAIAATLLIFGGIFLIPNNVDIPEYIIPIIYCWGAYYAVQHFQGPQINEHINSGEKVFGWWRVVLIGLIGLVVLFVFLLIASFAADIFRYYLS